VPKFGHTESPDGTTIAYETVGTGPGLILLSGSVVAPSTYAKLTAILGKTFTVHTVHRRGRGRSGPQGPAYSIEKECQDAIAVLDATGSHIIFGHSFGGLIAVETGRRQPETLHHVVAYDPALPMDSPAVNRTFLPAVDDALRRGHVGRALTIVQRSLQVGGRLDTLPAAVAVAVNWLQLTTVGRGSRPVLPTVLKEAAQALSKPTRSEAFATLTAKSLILVGQHSPRWIRDNSAALVAAAPAARYHCMATLDHNGPIFQPRAVAAAASLFLDCV
jgi:pimeloyl-ACP methyl ester carboxylesterase